MLCNCVPQIWDIEPVVGKTDRFRVRLTDGATCAAGAVVGPAGKAITDGEIGDCDLIELDGGSVSSVAGKLMVNAVDGILRKQPPAHAEVPFVWLDGATQYLRCYICEVAAVAYTMLRRSRLRSNVVQSPSALPNFFLW